MTRPRDARLPAARRRVAPVLERILAEVTIPNPFAISGFCHALAEYRHRPIRLIATSRILGADRSPPFSGMWIAAVGADYVIYDDTTSETHWTHSIFHELGHILLYHRSTSDDPDEEHLRLLALLMPDLHPRILRDAVRSGLCRRSGVSSAHAHYDDVQERDAELLGTMLGQRCGGADLDAVSPDLSERDSGIVNRLATVLGLPGRDSL